MVDKGIAVLLAIMGLVAIGMIAWEEWKKRA